MNALSLAVYIALASSVAAQQEPPEFPRLPSGTLVEGLSGEQPGAAGEALSPRSIVQVAIDLIKAFEGWYPDAYDDPAGYCTIGYGHLLAKKLCREIDLGKYATTMTKDDGDKLLIDDTGSARLAVQRLVKVDLSPRQFGAVTSFVFNVGAGNFGSSTMLKLLNEKKYDQAAGELRKWVRAKGQVLPGLIIRRNCEAALFKGLEIARLKNGNVDLRACGAEVGAAPNLSETIDVTDGTVYPE